MKTRTRYAPSPTGYMHIGNLRTAIFEYLVAKHDGGDFILRIEDTDQQRKVEGAIDFIYDTLNLCNIKIDEGPNNHGEYGPYIQSERKEIYNKYAHELVEKGKAYYCFCSEERLEELRKKAEIHKVAFMYDGHCSKLGKEEIEKRLKNKEPYVIRQKMPKIGKSTFTDLVYGKISVENKILEDQILLKSDGYPTYNFANVIDDHLMQITHVIRGNEYLSQTPKYNLLYEAFGFEPPKYIHVPMVLGEDKNKLSKRNGDASFMDLYHEGYLPNAIVNYLALLGWSPKENKEIFSMEELIKDFDPTRISKSPAVYDIKKLQWINSHYIKNMEEKDYLTFVMPYLKEQYKLENYDNNWLQNLALLYKNELKYGKEIIPLTKMFFEDNYTLNQEEQEFMNTEGVDKTINCFKEKIKTIKWTTENIKNAILEVKNECNVSGKMLYMPIRIKTTGLMHGPELDKTIYLLGQHKIMERLSK